MEPANCQKAGQVRNPARLLAAIASLAAELLAARKALDPAW